MKDKLAYESIADFYAGKSVFITGGTGYLGKMFIEKLLYACPEIGKIYVLIRDKRNVSAQERIRNVIENVIFTRLKNKRPKDLEKIKLIIGDIGAPNLGITPQDEHILLQQVSVVIHSAATINFNEPLKVAMKLNVEGTEKVLNLCRRMKNIKAFVHISTAFSNTDKRVIDEIVYPPPAELRDVYTFIEQYGDDKSTRILNGRPNTYTFTKAIAEAYVERNHGDIQTIIIRPSIVTPALNEPLPGWVDNWSGSTAMLVPVGKGYCHAILCDSDNVLDIVPVDYVSNLTLVAAAKCNRSSNVTVINYCSSSMNPVKTSRLTDWYIEESVKYRFNEIPFPFVIFTRFKWVVNIITFITATLPACFADIWLFIRGRPSKYLKMLAKIETVRDVMEFFIFHSWVWNTGSFKTLFESLSPSDQELFPFDITAIDWENYTRNYFMGVNKYLIEGGRKTL